MSQKRNPLNFLWCINVLTFPIELLLFGAKLSQEKVSYCKNRHKACMMLDSMYYCLDNNLSLHVIVEKFHCCMHQKSDDCLQTRVGHWWPYWIKKITIRVGKVEKISEDSLDSISSPSVKIQITGWCQQTFCYQKFVYNTQQCFAFTPQANFPAHNLNFHWRWRWWDQIQATF